MGEYTEECINTFLMNQGQLFDEPVAENYDEAEAFLEDCLCSRCRQSGRRARLHGRRGHGRGRNVGCRIRRAERSLFALPDGQYLIVMG